VATGTLEAGGQGTVVPPIPKELADGIQNGECVLFAGSGLSAQAGFPTWNQFLSGLLGFARERKVVDPSLAEAYAESLDQGERNAVADGIVHAFGSGRGDLQDYLLRTFPDTAPLPRVHEFLRQIPFASVVTSNYDTLLERALPQFADAGVYTPRDAEALLDALTQRRRFILKLYGIIRRPETLIVAPIEYRDVVLSNLTFSKFVDGLFVSRTFFFLGISLEGIQDFLSAFSFRGSAQPRKHFALLPVSGSAWRTKADLLGVCRK
jgi:SIR2-like domain